MYETVRVARARRTPGITELLFGIDGGAHTTLLHKDAENAGKRLHTGTQMFGVALGCSSLLPPLECTWGKIVIIIKFRLVRSILRVDGLEDTFAFLSRGTETIVGTKRVQLRIQPAAESRCNRCLGNHPLRDTSGSLGIP